jgi:hypothetical protein
MYTLPPSIHPYKLPPSTCAECEIISRALQTAWRHDTEVLRARVVDVANASGADVMAFDVHWVFSLAAMPDADMKKLLEFHYPQVREAILQRDEHERVSGHSVMGNVWWTPRAYGWAGRE